MLSDGARLTKTFLEDLTTLLAVTPPKVDVRLKVEAETTYTVFHITLEDVRDAGILIGKQGATIAAIRQVVSALCCIRSPTL